MVNPLADSGPLSLRHFLWLFRRMVRWLGQWHWAVVALTVFALTTLVYQLPRPWQVDVGGPYDGPWLSGFHDREGDKRFTWRWTTSEARVNLPGVGAGWYDLYIDMAAGGAERTLPRVSVSINGRPKGQFVVGADYAPYRIALSPQDFLAGDVEIVLRSETFVPPRDPRSLGVAVDAIRLTPSAPVPRLPALGTLVFALLVSFVSAAGLAVARVGRRPTICALGTMLAVYAAGLAANRIEVATFLPRLLTASLLAAPIPYVVMRLLGATRVRRDGPDTIASGGDGLEGHISSPVGTPLAPAVATFAFLVGLAKLGGTLYPQIVIIDLPFHLGQIRQVLAGNFLKLYLPGPLSLAVMPEKEWTVRAPIPYSPFFYLFMSPLGWLPVDMRQSVPLVNALLEAWKLPLVILLGLRLKLSKGEAGLGGLVYGLAAAMYMLLQWGNWPTTFSQWFALAGLTMLLVRESRARFLLAGFLLAVAFISYTVTAAFLLTMLVGLSAVWAFAGRDHPERGLLATATLTLAGAWLVAFLAYYSAHAYVAVTQTLPAFAGALASQGTLTTRTGTVWQYVGGNISSLGNYGLLPILIIGLWGAALAWLRLGTYHRAIVGLWIGVLVLFGLVGYKVDMVLKHVWFTVPLLAALSGPVLWNLGRRERAGLLLASGVLVYLTWASISLWTWRIWEASH